MKLASLAEAYSSHLQASGKSPSTCATAKRTLARFVAHLGADRETNGVRAEDLDGFFALDVVTEPGGRPRAQATIAQVQRIVRAAVTWGREQEGQSAGPPESQPTPTARSAQPGAPAAPLPCPAPASRPSYLDLTFQGQPARFTKTEVDRAELYGLRKLVALDAQGHECKTALLTHDGRFVLPPGSTADLYIDDSGDAVLRRDICAPSSTPAQDKLPEVTGPIDASELLDFVVTRVYALQPVALPATLARALPGALFRVPYRLRTNAADAPAFLLGNTAGAFLLLAEPHGFDFVAPDQPVLPADDSESNDLDAFAFPDAFGAPHDP